MLYRNNKRRGSSTQESLPLSKLGILNDKLLSSKTDFPIMKSLQTSDLDSISKERACSRYWTTCSAEASKKLWLPIRTDCVGLDMTYSSTYLKNTEPFLKSLTQMASNNLFKSSQRTSCQSLQCSQLDTTDQGNITYCRKIRIYPSPEQSKLFLKCLGANRYFYNRANAFVKERLQAKEENIFNRITIRNHVVIPNSELTADTMWQKEIPYDTRQFAIDQLLAAYKACFALKKNGHIETFDVKFKSKKELSAIFQVNKNALDIDKLMLFKRKCKSSFKVSKRDLKKLKEGVDCNFTVLRTKPNKWYLCLPRKKERPVYEQAAYKSVFLDPGVRTFMTFYSPDGVCGKIGDAYSLNYIEPLMQKIDHFESVRSTSSGRTQRNIKRRLYKLRDKAKNRVSDLHSKTCNYLCSAFDTIFLPDFKVSEMVEKVPGRVISKKTVRNMLNLSHCAFRTKLQDYAKTKHRRVVLINESYTTKTCGHCGTEQNIGGSKVFSCECGYTLDRDYHGARNMAIKILS